MVVQVELCDFGGFDGGGGRQIRHFADVCGGCHGRFHSQIWQDCAMKTLTDCKNHFIEWRIINIISQLI